MTIYLALALLFACGLAGHELDEERPYLASFLALLVALAWPIVLGIVLRAQLLTWRDAAVVKWKARRMRA